MNEEMRRLPTAEKTISEISENDMRVGFIGEIIERSNNRIVVGDEKKEIEVVYEGIDVPGSKIVRVVGLVRKPLHIQAEAIQNVSSLDLDLYRKAKSLLNIYK